MLTANKVYHVRCALFRINRKQADGVDNHYKPGGGMRAIDKIEVELAVVVGRASLPIAQLLRLGRGAVIMLDTKEDDHVDVMINNTAFAIGQVVVQDEQICVEIERKVEPLSSI
jgi:flagellar motor switch protein FliN/FliY